MALRDAFGFELMSVRADLISVFNEGQGGASTLACNATASRFVGGQGLEINCQPGSFSWSGELLSKTYDNQATWVFGFAYQVLQCDYDGDVICQLNDVSTAQLMLRRRSTGVLELWRGGSPTLLGTSTLTVPLNTWHYIELQATINSATGSFTVKIDGATAITASGVNTRNTANSYANTIVFGTSPVSWGGGFSSNNGNHHVYFDDMYLFDGTGSQNNAPAGDSRVLEQVPTGDGNYKEWTQSGGTVGSHYTDVNQIPHDADTTYVTSSTVNQRETFTFPAVNASATVLGVIDKAFVRKDDANAHTVRGLDRRAATDTLIGSAQNLALGYAQYSWVMDTDPNGGATWTPTTVNASELGVEIIT